MPKNRIGATLVEILVVLTIIAILAALSMPALQRALNAAQDTDIRNQLHQIAVAYCDYIALNERGPNSQQELSPFYENNSTINDAITKKRLTVIWGLSALDMGSYTPVAYETKADRIGNHMVAMGDGSVQTLDGSGFAAMPKALGK